MGMDKRELKNISRMQKETSRQQLFQGLRNSFRGKPETLKLAMEIINLDAKNRTDGLNYYAVDDRFLDYLKLAFEKDKENEKWNKRPEREDLEQYEPDGKMLEEYKDELEKK